MLSLASFPRKDAAKASEGGGSAGLGRTAEGGGENIPRVNTDVRLQSKTRPQNVQDRGILNPALRPGRASRVLCFK